MAGVLSSLAPVFALMARDQAGYQQVPAEVVEKMDAEANQKLY